MKERQTIEYVHEDRLVAEVDVVAIETDGEWSPYYRPDDVRKLEAVRDALKRRDIAAASKLARVFEMTPVAAE